MARRRKAPSRKFRQEKDDQFSEALSALKQLLHDFSLRAGGISLAFLALGMLVALASFSINDPSFNNATPAPVSNLAGPLGASFADLALQFFGGASFLLIAPMAIWGIAAARYGAPEETPRIFWLRAFLAPIALISAAGAMALAPTPLSWPFTTGPGGVVGDGVLSLFAGLLALVKLPLAPGIAAMVMGTIALVTYPIICGLNRERLADAYWAASQGASKVQAIFAAIVSKIRIPSNSGKEAVSAEEPKRSRIKLPPMFSGAESDANNEEDRGFEEEAEYEEYEEYEEDEDGEEADESEPKRNIIRENPKAKKSNREKREAQPSLPVFGSGDYELPALNLLAKPNLARRSVISDQSLEQNARMLESVLSDFGVRGEIINVRPGPVVTLYELQPAAGVKSSRVIGLADDIARSMSAVAARVAVVPGRNVIGIELPNQDREMVYLRELLSASDYENSDGELTIALGKAIGGEAVFADLARMPHLLIAGTTGSGKSVGINTMILSLLYRLTPDECKLILIDPKMLELSVYEGIPHLLSPVVTDPRKAVVALKWTVREMEERYRQMSKVGVRNIEGFNQRIEEADEKGETLSRTVHTGYDQETGEPVYETEELDYDFMPFIVVVIDEVADLMMVAGKDIEGMVQRLAQMARAAGIHLIMATQRPSVDVITGTIKANFPTRISFQVTSKIDSRTILGEQGAEQLLGQGDMLHMAGGGRLRRVHGAFVSDDEVEKIVKFLKRQGAPEYVQDVTEMKEDDGGGGDGLSVGGNTSSGDALYDRAVAIVLRDRKASTSYVQRRLQIGYNRAATLIERMEEEGVISAANHAGKREILVGEDAA